MDKKKNTYLSELFLENLNGDFSRQAVLRALEKCNDEIRKRTVVQHFLLPKNFLKPYFRLIILSNFPYFYVVCAVCI